MALTKYQIAVIRLLSESRRRQGVSYIAGGTALNQFLGTERRSRDIDIFHDTTEALQATWDADKKQLLDNGFTVHIERETPSFVEADVCREKEHVLIQWARDSAFRFFPIIEDELMGLTLHPFDLATNKLLAMAGRLEPRDWIDTIECHRKVQQIGYLIWSACGKDPGVNPEMLFADAGRLHYSQQEIDNLDFDGKAPSAALMGREWKNALNKGKEILTNLPEEHLGECILQLDKNLYTGSAEQLLIDLQEGNILFHKGIIGGAWPQIVR